MTGLIKPKSYDWKDSNLALFGSDVEKQVKRDAAKSEPAWQNAGSEVGLQIWRIEKFEVVEWPKEEYGKFYTGDSYIILNTYKPDPSCEDLDYNLHFWIGSESSQDEYGTAAYKTVELDTYLNDEPVQYREVEGYESMLFKSYFPRGIQYLAGGVETGFKHVKPEAYKPRLFHFHGAGKTVVATQVPACEDRLNPNDVFILDLGLKVYQWNGSGANAFEKNKAMSFVNAIKTERSGKAVVTEVIDEDNKEHPFYSALTEENVTDPICVSTENIEKQLFKVSDAGGQTEFTKIKSGSIKSSDFDSNDVFIMETTKSCFVWVGNGCSPNEKQSGLGYAHNYLMSSSHPLRPIVVIKEGRRHQEFQSALAA